MENQARFRFLQLDFVTIREVLNILDPFDYINFSKASKRCRKLSTIKKSYEVFFYIRDNPEVLIGNRPIYYGVKWTKEKEKDGTRDDRTEPDQLQEIVVKYSENPSDSMKELYLYARSLMSINIGVVSFYMNDFKGKCREIFDGLRSTFHKVLIFQIHGKDQRKEELQYILDNVKCTRFLQIYATTIEELSLKVPETIDDLHIEYGSWITLDYLMSLKMSTIILRNTNLTNEDINGIYKSWMEVKSHQNLEYLEISVMNLENFVGIALKDIPYKMGPTISGHDPSYTQLEGIFEVTRKDGQTAFIGAFEQSEELVAIMFFQPPLFEIAESCETNE
ncbi:unnamed protein product [Caenorhabditis nigoni]